MLELIKERHLLTSHRAERLLTSPVVRCIECISAMLVLVLVTSSFSIQSAVCGNMAVSHVVVVLTAQVDSSFLHGNVQFKKSQDH